MLPVLYVFMGQVFDIAVVGATAAGYAAAHYLAKRGCEVVLVDAPHVANECPLTDWAPGNFFRLKGIPKSLRKDAGATEFERVCYHDLKLEKHVQSRLLRPLGVLVEYSRLCKAFHAAAVKANVKFRSSTTPPTIQLEEDQVRLVGTTQVVAKLLLITHSQPGEGLVDLAIPGRMGPRSQLVVAALNVPVGSEESDTFDRALHVLELPERTELGLFFAFAGTVHLRVISNSPAAGTRASELSSMVTDLQRAGILPGSLQLGRARGAVWHPPAAAALELESHVAKRCILAGTAGGFAESITGQTLRPSVESALLAADAAMAALKSPDTQETLMRFKTSWRKHMADYLRPPTTALHLLLPLLFVNQSIVGKFTRALLYGENI